MALSSGLGFGFGEATAGFGFGLEVRAGFGLGFGLGLALALVGSRAAVRSFSSLIRRSLMLDASRSLVRAALHRGVDGLAGVALGLRKGCGSCRLKPKASAPHTKARKPNFIVGNFI